jgi:hypothetical protein
MNGSGNMPASMIALRDALKAEFADKKLVVEPAILRVEQVLTNTKFSYDFDPMIGNGGAQVETEIKLDKNDVFFASHIGFKLGAFDVNKRSRSVLQTYPNVIELALSGTTVPGIQDMEAIYNGLTIMKVGTKEFVSNLPNESMRYVPQTQQAGANNKSQASAYDGLIDIGKFRISGLDAIKITCSIPAFGAGAPAWAAVTAGWENRLVLITKGFLIKGLAQSISKLEPSMSGC